MSRVRVSTTVDGDLLDEARRLRFGANDATLLDEALGALVARNRASEITYFAHTAGHLQVLNLIICLHLAHCE